MFGFSQVKKEVKIKAERGTVKKNKDVDGEEGTQEVTKIKTENLGEPDVNDDLGAKQRKKIKKEEQETTESSGDDSGTKEVNDSMKTMVVHQMVTERIVRIPMVTGTGRKFVGAHMSIVGM